MLLAGKAVHSGIVFLLLTTWISGPRPALLNSRADRTAGVQAIAHADDINKVQQTLQDKGHYRGKIDGVIGLRTRASIRAYQKADNLPVTGQLDLQTAGKLGVAPEAREEIGSDASQEKPSAGIAPVKGSLRNGRRLHKPIKE
jgi:peptidoglycan hydrolase-like protein with peptidoglycan-binding domain